MGEQRRDPKHVLRVAHHGVVAAWRERERALRRLGLDVELLSARRWNEGGTDVTLDPGDDSFIHTAGTLGRHPNVFAYAPSPVWRLLARRWDLLDLHEEPCALATAEILALRWLRRVRTPFVLYSAQNIPKRYPIPFRWFEKAALRHAAGAYVCNEQAGQILVRKGLRGPVRVIGLGVDLAQFVPGEAAGPHDRLRVGYAGRLEPHKGVSVLLAAIATLPDARLELAGEGPLRASLEREAIEFGIGDRVRFLGFLGERLADFYRGLDVLVVSSLDTPGWLEQFGRVAVEAMACGVPVVASRSGALPDVVADAGLLVEPGDPAAIRAALLELTDPGRWRRAREAGLVVAQRYGWPAVAAQQRELYDAALAFATRPSGAEPPGDRPIVTPAPLEIVVVAYGDPAPLDDALGVLQDKYPITIVDNSSRDDTRLVAERHGAHYVDPGTNLGFAAGVNAALASLDDRGRDRTDVLLLNPDATIAPADVEALRAAMIGDPTLACVAPRQDHPGQAGSERVVWPFPSPAAAWLGAMGAARLDRRHGFVIGSILLLRRAALDDVGRFDEGFFLYAEETDWQYRATRRGWRTGFVPDAYGTHVGAGTGGDSHARLVMFHTSLRRYMRKHYGRRGAASFRAAMVAGAAVRGLLGRGETRRSARQRLRLYLAAPEGGVAR